MPNKIREGIEVLGKYGWHQGGFGNKRVGFCLLGAVKESRISYNDTISIFHTEEYFIIRDVILEQFPERLQKTVDIVPLFNDHPDTKVEDVIMVMEKAAVELDARI